VFADCLADLDHEAGFDFQFFSVGQAQIGKHIARIARDFSTFISPLMKRVFVLQLVGRRFGHSQSCVNDLGLTAISMRFFKAFYFKSRMDIAVMRQGLTCSWRRSVDARCRQKRHTLRQIPQKVSRL
jgi:hypothetical protein